MNLLKALVRKMRKMAIIDIAVQIRKGKMISSWVLDRKIQRYLKVKELPDKEILAEIVRTVTGKQEELIVNLTKNSIQYAQKQLTGYIDELKGVTNKLF